MVFATGVTAGGWGTLNRQMAWCPRYHLRLLHTGRIHICEYKPFQRNAYNAYAWLWLAALFRIPAWTLFTDKRYKVKHLIIAALVFYSVQYILKATLAHPILELFHPRQRSFSQKGLAEQGLDLNQWLMYLKHFNGMSWPRKSQAAGIISPQLRLYPRL